MPIGTVFIPEKLPDLRPCARNRWGAGVDVAQSMAQSRVMALCGDGGDGCYVAVLEFPQASAASLKLVHVSGSGQVQASAVVQTPVLAFIIQAALVPAPGGGCIVVFATPAHGAPLLAQRFDAQCQSQWPQALRVLPSAGGFTGLDAIGDGAGGAIVAVNSANVTNGSGRNVLAQRISAAGALQWPAGGVALSGPPAAGGKAQLALALAGNRVGAVWLDPNPTGPSPITGAWLDLSGNVTAGPFPIGLGFDFRHDAAPRRVVADPDGAMYVAFSPDPISAPLVVQRFEADADVPAWTRSTVALSHPQAYSLAADGSGGFLLATVETNGTVSVDKVDASNISHWRFTSARHIATVAVGALANQLHFNHARLVTVTARDKGGALVSFEDHGGEVPKLMSWCCDEKGAAATRDAIVAVSQGAGRQSDALAVVSAGDTSIVAWQESSGVSATLIGAQKLGCCPPNVPPGRLLEPPPPLPCGIPVGFPWVPGGGRFGFPLGGLRLLLTCGGRGWRGGLLPLPALYGQPGIRLPGSFGVQGVPAPSWTRLTFTGLPSGTTLELFTHKGDKVATAKAVDGGGATVHTLEFAPSAKRSYVLVFVVKGKGLEGIDVPVGLHVEAGVGKPPVVDAPFHEGAPDIPKGKKKKSAAAGKKTSAPSPKAAGAAPGAGKRKRQS
jgi:hypothetical protein